MKGGDILSRFSVPDVAQKLNLKAEIVQGKTEWHGANPSGVGATTDGFILYEEGNAWDRSLDMRYRSFEVARLAKIEIGDYEPCVEYSNVHSNGHTNGSSNGSSNGHANGYSNGSSNGAAKVAAPKVSTPKVAAPKVEKKFDLRTLEERGVTRATMGQFHISLCTRSNGRYADYRCYEYPTYYADGRTARSRQKVCDPTKTAGAKYFWAGGDKDHAPAGYNLHNVRSWVEQGVREIWIVEGEVSTWLMQQSGLPCVNPFGSLSQIDKLIRQLKEIGIERVQIVFDCDTAGRSGALKTLAAARFENLQANVRKLLAPVESGFDVADLYGNCNGDVERFKTALNSLPVVSERELERWKNGDASSEEPSRNEKSEDGKLDEAKAAKAEKLLAMIDNTPGVELFYTSDDECYIKLPQKSAGGNGEFGDSKTERVVTYPLNDSKFQRHLVHRYQRETGKVLEAAVVENVIRVLEGRAFESGVMQPVAVRVGEFKGKIYLDLCNENWEAVEIDGEGWRVITNAPVHFRRAKGMEPLPKPERGGDWNELRQLVNASDDNNWIMCVSWLITALRPPKYPYPILAVHGEQNSSKSTMCRIMRRLIDPNYTLLVGTSTKDERDLAIIAKNSFVIGFDNLSRVPQWFNDVLCSLATEGSFRTRKMRADDEEMIFKARRPIIINGINENVGQNDLRRRMFKLWLPAIPEEEMRDEMELVEAFEEAWPRILGLICDALSVANEFVGGVTLPRRVGLVDAAKWVMAAAPALPFTAEDFATCYLENQQAAIDAANEASPLTTAIITMLDRLRFFKGTSTELLHELNGIVGEDVRRHKSWPDNETSLGIGLSRVAPNLRAVGIEFIRPKGRSNGRQITLRRLAPDEAVEAINNANAITSQGDSSQGDSSQDSAPESSTQNTITYDEFDDQ